ncbi:MAG: hypothetical protein LKI17_06460 [Megasphaera cerevisiae]|jgi:hypothetical protein|nr:hypothetical protein [Megasphaera cerevisiae]
MNKIMETLVNCSVSKTKLSEYSPVTPWVFRKIETGEWYPSAHLERLIIERIECLECIAINTEYTQHMIDVLNSNIKYHLKLERKHWKRLAKERKLCIASVTY